MLLPVLKWLGQAIFTHHMHPQQAEARARTTNGWVQPSPHTASMRFSVVQPFSAPAAVTELDLDELELDKLDLDELGLSISVASTVLD